MGKVAEMRVIVGDKKDPDRAAQSRAEELRILEALLFAAETPLDEKVLATRLPASRYFVNRAGDIARASPVFVKPSPAAPSTGNSRAGCSDATPVRSCSV